MSLFPDTSKTSSWNAGSQVVGKLPDSRLFCTMIPSSDVDCAQPAFQWQKSHCKVMPQVPLLSFPVWDHVSVPGLCSGCSAK